MNRKEFMVGSDTGPRLNCRPLNPVAAELPAPIPVVDQPVQIERNETRRAFLHIV